MAITTAVLRQLEDDRETVNNIMSQFYADNRYTWRVKTLLDRNPYLADNMGAVLQMAQMPVSDDELFQTGGAAYGMQTALELGRSISKYTPSVQRAIYANLTSAQQKTLQQMGYKVPQADVDEGGFFEQLLGKSVDVVGDVAGGVAKGIGRTVWPIVEPGINLLDEGWNLLVGRNYRTIRQLGTDAQIAAIIGAVAAGAGALALAPVTGGVSLGAAGAGLSAILGGTAAAGIEQAVVGNADDFFNAWSRAGNGEQLFTDAGVRQAEEILGDPRLISLAQRVAMEMDDSISLSELARQIAGVRDSTNPATQQKQVTKIAKELAQEGTPEYNSVYAGLVTLISNPLFQDAVEKLEQSKISMGRDVANLLNLDPDSDGYRWISGTVDAASLLFLDPLLVAGKAASVYNMARRGMKSVDATSAAIRFRELAQLPEVERKFQLFVDSVNSGSARLANRYARDLMPVWNEFVTHAQLPGNAGRAMTVDDFVDWVVTGNQMRSIMRGVGLTKGLSYGSLKGLNRFQYASKTATGALRDFIQGAADVSVEGVIKKLADDPDALGQLFKMLPAEWRAHIAHVSADEAPEVLSKYMLEVSGVGGTAYALGRQAAVLPGVKNLATMFDNMMTLSPRGTIIAIDNLSGDAVSDIDAFIDMMKTAGAPSYVREIWKRGIYEAPDVGTRLNLVASMIDSLASATGIRGTLDNATMLDNILGRFSRHYAMGRTGRFTLRRGSGLNDIDEIPIGTLPEAHMATMMQIPDLKAMRQAVRQGTWFRVLVGVADSTPVNAFQNKYWKPAVLIRFGFVVRNGTEDLLAFLTRAGMGHMVQSGAARSIGQETVFKEGLEKLQPQMLRNPDVASNARLTNPELWAQKKRWDIPAHMRPVARVVERFGTHGSPGITFLSEYGKWLRYRLRNGAGWQQVYKRGLGEATEATAQRSARLENFYQNLDHLAFGGEYSIRRLILGGANQELVRSAEAFSRKNMGSIMQRVGASSYLPWQAEHDGDQIVYRKIKNRRGEEKEVAYRVRISGERTLVKRGTPRSVSDLVNTEDTHDGILRGMTELTDDGPATEVTRQVLKIYDEELQFYLPPDELKFILELWDEVGGVAMYQDDHFLRLVLELAQAEKNPNRFQALIQYVDEIQKGSTVIDPQTAEMFDPLLRLLRERFTGNAVPTIEEMYDLVDEAHQIARASATGQVTQQFLADQYSFRLRQLQLGWTIQEITNVPARKWISANLAMDAATGGNHLSGPGLTLREMLINWEQGGYINFWKDLDSAIGAGLENLLNQYNQGQWDGIFSQNRDYIPGAPTTKFHVVQMPPGIAGVDRTVLAQNFVDSNGVPVMDEWARLLGVDLQGLTVKQQEEFEKFVYIYLDAIERGVPFVVSDREVATVLRNNLADLVQRLDMRTGWRTEPEFFVPHSRVIYLPVVESDDLFDLYPDLVDKAVTRSTAIPSSLGENIVISGINWDVQTYPFPEQFLDVAREVTYPQNIFNRLGETVRQQVRSGRRTRLVVRDNVTLYQNLNGEAVEIEPGTVIEELTNLFSDKEMTKAVEFDNMRYLQDEEVFYEGNETILWNILAPILYDQAEELAGAALYNVKNARTVRTSSYFTDLGINDEKVSIATDVVRSRRSSVMDVQNTPAELLPDMVSVQTYEPVVEGSWNRFVQTTFNEVFSPILDAIARRPMAFHAFTNAYKRNMASVSWLFRGSEEETKLNGVISSLVAKSEFGLLPDTLMPRFVEAGRILAEVQDVPEFIYWTDEQVLAFIRSLDSQDLANLPSMFEYAARSGRISADPAKATALGTFIQDNHAVLQTMFFDGEMDAWSFIDRIDAVFGEGSARRGFIQDARLRRQLSKLRQGKSLSATELAEIPQAAINWDYALTLDDWNDIKRGAIAREKAYETAEEYAAEYAIRDIMPFIDTHEVRSQFSDWARGFLPFWYAEENFLKRWARIFALEGPAGGLARARKLQLGANGLRTMGIVREDPNGNSYFVYPGSDLLMDVMEKLPGLNMLPISAMLQTPTDRMIPGFNAQFGSPGFSPLIALPLEFATFMFPESTRIKNFQRNIMGDISVNQDILSMILPAQVVHSFKAIYEYAAPYENAGNERLMSAMVTAIAHLEATDQGLSDNPQANEIDDYLRRVRNHARVIVLSQALAGWFTPGPAQVLQVPEGQNSISWLTSGQIQNPQEILSATYYELVKELGIEDGTIAYLERFPDGSVKDVLDPIAYTISKTESVSGSPLPRSEDGIQFYEDNKDLFDQYKFAGPWMLPADAADLEESSQYAYDSEMINGMRTRKTPEEFLLEVKYKEGASVYFAARKEYMDATVYLESKGDSAGLRALDGKWEIFSNYWRATHPVFADQLVSSDARERRQNTIDQMRLFLEDPLAPKASHFDQMKVLMENFDAFNTKRGELNLNRTASGRTKVELLKKSFEEWVTKFVYDNPKVNAFWLTVLRPESGLD